MKLLKSIIITYIVGFIWCVLEYAIYGMTENRAIDNIMLVVFGIVIYLILEREVNNE